MQNYSWTVTFKTSIDTKKIQDKHLLIETEESDFTTIFIFGKTKLETSDELIDQFKTLWELEAYDISISTEDNMTMLNNEVDKEGLYEVVSFESPVADIRNIIERFEDSFDVICIREAEESEKFGNRVIRADFIY